MSRAPVEQGEGLARRWARRTLTLSSYGLLCLLLLGLSPLALPLLAVVDLLRRTRLGATRFWLMVTVYFVLEMLGVVGALGVWIAGGPKFLDRNYRLQRWWVRALFFTGARIYGLVITVEDAELAAQGPMLLFVRHVSLIDALLPTVFVSDRAGIRLRFVLKAALLFDPCLDIVGQRIPNVFVRRGREAFEREVAAIAALARDLEAQDGVIIFPEGTRNSPEMRAKIRASLAARQDPTALERMDELMHVLPPRIGGLKALLGRGAGADPVFLGHKGLESVRRFGDLLNGRLVGARIAIKFWREPSAAVPTDEAAALAWFHEQWKRLDRWVGQA